MNVEEFRTYCLSFAGTHDDFPFGKSSSDYDRDILVFYVLDKWFCFVNAVAWDFHYGQPFDKATRNEVFASCQPDYIAGLSLLGGEPMEPENQRELLPFVRNFKALYPNKTVWCYSGYTWEQLTGKEPSLARCEATDELLSLLDVLVDGEFVQAKHDISLRFRGSSNQRLLDVKKTLTAGQPVWWEDEKVFATHTMEK